MAFPRLNRWITNNFQMPFRGIKMKTCSKCGITKSVREFNKKSQARDGLRGECMACMKEYMAAYYLANAVDSKVKYAAYRAANIDR